MARTEHKADVIQETLEEQDGLNPQELNERTPQFDQTDVRQGIRELLRENAIRIDADNCVHLKKHKANNTDSSTTERQSAQNPTYPSDAPRSREVEDPKLDLAGVIGIKNGGGNGVFSPVDLRSNETDVYDVIEKLEQEHRVERYKYAVTIAELIQWIRTVWADDEANSIDFEKTENAERMKNAIITELKQIQPYDFPHLGDKQ